jgi:RNA polymerase sigma-70 factor, ECF subfamily
MANRFDEIVQPHLDAAHRLARSLLRNEDDAEDAVQEAALRAHRYLHTFDGGNERAWFLRIVRHVCWRSYRRTSVPLSLDVFDEQRHSDVGQSMDPEAQLMRRDDVTLVDRAIRNLPRRSRQLLRLRELDGLSYRELAREIGVPLGTVMSGLSRARDAFRGALQHELKARASVV